MLPEIVRFNKSMQYRLEEYQQLLDTTETPCSEIIEIWASIFEDLVVIKPNWQALWMLSEENCRKYELLYPTAVIVIVEDFNWQNLAAEVKVLAVQEDIILPSMLEVPVIELHPIKYQDYDETDLKDIEDWLDKCRYFFKNLWYPWDAKLDVSIMDWCENHLKKRLKMQYDIINGVFTKAITHYLKSLLAEAQNINSVSENSFSVEEDETLMVVRKYIRKKAIKTELDLFEEPDLRYGMILLKKKERSVKSSLESLNKPEVKLVWPGGNCQSLIEHLKVSQSMIGENVALQVCGSLQDALDTSNTNGIIILSPGVHVMSFLKGLENGGIIKGLSKMESLIVPDSSAVSRAILFECFGSVEIENLTISKPSGIVIQVYEGTVKISNCRILSKNNNSTTRGIVVIPSCKLIVENCELRGFGTAIALQKETQASIVNTKITDCFEGIKVMENASLSLNQVEISSCSTYGIRIESAETNAPAPLVGDLSLLRGIRIDCEISASSVTFSGNNKGNVIIKKSENPLIFDDVSVNDTSVELICISDEDTSINDSIGNIPEEKAL